MCATVLAYFVYFSFAMAMNFQKAIPLLCITAFVCFCTSYALVKRKFGSRIAKSMHITRLKGCCSPLSRKLSMYVFNDKWILTKGSILSIKIVTNCSQIFKYSFAEINSTQIIVMKYKFKSGKLLDSNLHNCIQVSTRYSISSLLSKTLMEI